MSIEPRRERRRVALNGPTMGNRWSAVFYAEAATDLVAVETALAEAVGTVDAQMSTWKPQSALMQLNRMPVGAWMDVSDALAFVLALGLGIGRASGGRFDMAVLRSVEAAGFGPSQHPGAAAEARDGRDTLEVDLAGGRARRLADVAFDLSGIAKGFGVDLMARTLEALGLTDHLVTIDGEVLAGGRHPDGRAWHVAIETPDLGHRGVGRVAALGDCALATSGDYRHCRLENGRRIAHTIDPRTGRPVDNALASVTVRAPDCAVADAWATALMVAGEVEGPHLASANGIDALFYVRAGEELRIDGTGCFAEAAAAAA